MRYQYKSELRRRLQERDNDGVHKDVLDPGSEEFPQLISKVFHREKPQWSQKWSCSFLPSTFHSSQKGRFSRVWLGSTRPSTEADTVEIHLKCNFGPWQKNPPSYITSLFAFCHSTYLSYLSLSREPGLWIFPRRIPALCRNDGLNWFC